MSQTFRTELENRGFDCRFRLVGEDGTVVASMYVSKAYEANYLNDAFAKFAELNRIPFKKADALYVHPFPAEGP